MKMFWFLVALLAIVVCAPAQRVEAQWFPGNGMIWPNKVPFGFYGAAINPYMGIQGNYGPAVRPSPQALYVQGRNNGAVDPVTGQVRGWGTTSLNGSYQIAPQEIYVPPPESRQNIIPRMRWEEEQRKLQQQALPQSPTPLDTSPPPVPNPPTARRQYQVTPQKPNPNRYVAQYTIPNTQVLQTSNRNR